MVKFVMFTNKSGYGTIVNLEKVTKISVVGEKIIFYFEGGDKAEINGINPEDVEKILKGVYYTEAEVVYYKDAIEKYKHVKKGIEKLLYG